MDALVSLAAGGEGEGGHALRAALSSGRHFKQNKQGACSSSANRAKPL